METHLKVNPPQITRCPNCGNMTMHILIHREDYSEVIDETEDGHPIWDDRWWAILKCTTCDKLSLYHDYWDENEKKWRGILAYPIPLSVPNEVPESIRTVFDEALSVIHCAPSLAVVGIRRSLEAIVEDQRAEGRNLAARIRFLGSKGDIPQILIDMMESGRLIGNIGAHYGRQHVTQDDVLVLVEFTRAIFEYIYVAPARIASIRKSLERRGVKLPKSN